MYIKHSEFQLEGFKADTFVPNYYYYYYYYYYY